MVTTTYIYTYSERRLKKMGPMESLLRQHKNLHLSSFFNQALKYSTPEISLNAGFLFLGQPCKAVAREGKTKRYLKILEVIIFMFKSHHDLGCRQSPLNTCQHQSQYKRKTAKNLHAFLNLRKATQTSQAYRQVSMAYCLTCKNSLAIKPVTESFPLKKCTIYLVILNPYTTKPATTSLPV